MRRLSRSSMDGDSDHNHLDTAAIEERLKSGKQVIFLLKYEGSFIVEESRGVAPVRGAFKELRKMKEERRKKGIRHSPVKEFVLSLSGVTIRDPITKEDERVYGIRSISYIVNDEKNRNYIGMIAQNKGRMTFECTILKQPEGRAREVVHALGTAFDAAYQDSLSKPRTASQSSTTSKRSAAPAAVPEKKQTPIDELSILRTRLRDLAVLVPEDILEKYLQKHRISDITEIPGKPTKKTSVSSINEEALSPTVGRRLENLCWEDMPETESAPSSRKNSTGVRERSQSDAMIPRVNPPPKNPRQRISRPVSTISLEDPFEMGDFNGVSFPDFEDFCDNHFQDAVLGTDNNQQIDLLA